ncbi:MAG: trypsin-like peptidase domain-containing protein, partial [Acidimicrobiia bacterium]
MTNDETTQQPAASTTEQSPVSDENPTLHGSIATEAPSTEEIPDTPQPAQVPPPAEPTQPAKTGSARTSPWLIAFLAVLLVVGSSAATYLITTIDNDEVPAAQTAEPGPDEQEATAELVPGEEPVADAAAVILPSVVQIQAGQGVGSGVIYDSSGLILTAAHVVEGADTVTVRFADGEQVEGTVLGGTAGADVAVIQVEGTDLPAAELALDDAPQVGQMAIAVGSPWGLQGTVTSGIISAVDQAIPQGASAR